MTATECLNRTMAPIQSFLNQNNEMQISFKQSINRNDMHLNCITLINIDLLIEQWIYRNSSNVSMNFKFTDNRQNHKEFIPHRFVSRSKNIYSLCILWERIRFHRVNGPVPSFQYSPAKSIVCIYCLVMAFDCVHDFQLFCTTLELDLGLECHSM